MTIVMGLDQHRAQITAEWLNTESGEVSRRRVSPADRAGMRAFAACFRGQEFASRAIAHIPKRPRLFPVAAPPQGPKNDESPAFCRAFVGSGRQDLNLRPPGPQPDRTGSEDFSSALQSEIGVAELLTVALSLIPGLIPRRGALGDQLAGPGDAHAHSQPSLIVAAGRSRRDQLGHACTVARLPGITAASAENRHARGTPSETDPVRRRPRIRMMTTVKSGPRFRAGGGTSGVE